MNIFEALRVSHETQRALADQLIRTQGDSPERAVLEAHPQVVLFNGFPSARKLRARLSP